MAIILGVDFDNTLVNYDNVIYQSALQSGLIISGTEKNKKNIRDKIRELPDGEIKWQKLQAYVYGKGMENSILFDGVKEFFDVCRGAAINVFIISHKTEFASMDEHGINLRDTAIDWMKQNRFFDNEGLGLSPDKIYFEATRQGKIERIKQLGCTHFIDDLEETFLEKKFPFNTKKILFTPHLGNCQDKGVFVANDWKMVERYVFGTKE